jgi:predicted nucleic acid-binding protein
VNFLLDTNIYFAILHDAGFLERQRDVLLRIAPRTFLSSIVRAELLQGARGDLGRARVTRATRQLERVGRVVAPTHADWVQAGITQGRIWDDRPSLRSKSLLHDILIVTTLLRIGGVLISDNTKDFAVIDRYLPHDVLTLDDLAKVL